MSIRGRKFGQAAVYGKVITTTTTFDPSKKGTNVTLSGGNLTVTGSGLGVVLSIASHSTGKFYLESSITAGGAAVGFGNASLGLNSFLGASDNDSVACNNVGQIFINGAQVGSAISGFGPTNVVQMAVDFVNQKVWWKVDSLGWDNDIIANQNPATNTGGTSFSTINAGPYFAGTTIGSGSDTSTFNFGGTAYSFTPPAGFGNW